MAYAIVEISGKQFKVEANSTLVVDKLDGQVGDTLSFETVLMMVDGDNVEVGAPYLAGQIVTAEVTDQTKDKKIRVAKFKSKSRYRKVYGHRQHITKLLIKSLSGKKQAKASTKTSDKTAKPASKTPSKK